MNLRTWLLGLHDHKQGLFSTGPACFNLYLEKGRPVAEVFLRNGYYRSDMRALNVVQGADMKPGVWQKIRARHSALGALGRGDTFFNGRMRSFAVSVR